jgi:hypothetical protein
MEYVALVVLLARAPLFSRKRDSDQSDIPFLTERLNAERTTNAAYLRCSNPEPEEDVIAVVCECFHQVLLRTVEYSDLLCNLEAIRSEHLHFEHLLLGIDNCR